MGLAIVALVALIVVRLVGRSAALTAEPRFGTPNLHGEVMTIPGRPHEIHMYLTDPGSIRRRITYTYSTNSLGFRGPEFSREKQPETYRIAVVGECVAFGQGVALEQTWPYLLEQGLRRDLPGRSVEVLNFSNPDPFFRIQENLRLAMEFSPDLVFFAPGSDIMVMPQHGGGDEFKLQLDQAVYDRALDQYRHVLQDAADAARGRARLVLVTPTLNSFAMPDNDLWIDEVRRFAQENSLPLLDTSRLFRDEERRDGMVFERLNDGQQRLVAFHGGQPTVLIEAPTTEHHYIEPALYAWLDEHPSAGPALSIDENHPTPRGHELIATTAQQLLKEQGLP